MAIYKVSNAVFSTLKTIQKALQKAADNDTIQLSAGSYDEIITLSKTMTLIGKDPLHTTINGTFYVTKSSRATFEQLTFQLNTQMIIEGDVQFTNCHFEGQDVTAICAIDGGRATFKDCTFQNAKEIGLYIVHNSQVTLYNCTFINSKRAHILCEQASVQLENCTLANGQHAIWLKSEARGMMKHCDISSHSGTQIVIQQSIFEDEYSRITNGGGNGIFADGRSNVTVYGTEFFAHTLPQIWIKESALIATNCSFSKGVESAIMLMLQAEATLTHCYFQHHHLATVQAIDHSLLNMEDCQVYDCEGYGVQLRNKSIANFTNTIFAKNWLAQLHIVKHSIVSMKDCKIKDGKHIALHIEDRSSCDIAQSTIYNHPNTAIIVLHSDCNIFESEMMKNEGNGVLAMEDCQIKIEGSRFYDNGMPHIAAKHDVKLAVVESRFIRSKALYALKNCDIQLQQVHISDGDGIQIELVDGTKAHLQQCIVENGNSNGIKAAHNTTIKMEDCQISNHALPQIVINDSSLVCKDSEILEGAHNGFIIENHSDAYIQNCYIAKHHYPQLWIDQQCNVDVVNTQIKDGSETDIYVQNKSSVYIEQCVIQNDLSPFSIQAIDFSRVDIARSKIVNSVGELYYSENNSTITQKLDEVDY